MSKLWTVWLGNGLEANSHYLDSYDEALQVVHDTLHEGHFDLTEILIEEIELPL